MEQSSLFTKTEESKEDSVVKEKSELEVIKNEEKAYKNSNDSKEKENEQSKPNLKVVEEKTKDILLKELQSLVGDELPEPKTKVKVFKNMELYLEGEIVEIKRKNNEIVWIIKDQDKNNIEIIDNSKYLIEVTDNEASKNKPSKEESNNSEEDILDKIDNIEVSELDRIAEKDKAKMKELQNAFNEFREYIQETKEFIKSQKYIENNKYNLKYNDSSPKKILDTLKSDLGAQAESFIGDIRRYFEKEYNITLDTSEFRELYMSEIDKKFRRGYECDKEKIMKLHFEDVVEKIIRQLGGVSFKERAIEEIREDFRKMVSHYGGLKEYKLKNSKLSIWNLLYYYEDYSGVKKISRTHDCFTKLKTITDAFALFETGKPSNTPTHNYFSNFLARRVDKAESVTFGNHEITDRVEKINKIKLFKNGRIDIWFATREDAKSFTDTYMQEPY